MKRLAAVAVVLALVVLPACAQRGGSHGGFSGGHGGGFSSHGGGFSGGHSGFSAPRAPSFHSGSGNFVRSAPPRFPGAFNGSRPPAVRPPFRSGGPSQFVSQRMPYPGRGLRPVGPSMPGARRGVNSISHRMPYHSPRDGNGWNHRGGDHDHDRDRDHRGFGFHGLYGWAGYPYWPWWGWNYPFLFNDWDYNDDYDSQPAGNYAASQYPEYMPGPYDEAPPDQPEPQEPSYTPWPYSSPAPSASQPAPAALPSEAPVTLVFKDGRPNEQIHNYMLTSKTLSVLDQHRRDIPVDQLDLVATARVNREAGVDFSLPASPLN